LPIARLSHLGRSGPDRHPAAPVAVHLEAEVAGPVEALTADLGGDHGRTVALVELGDVELDGDADELAVAPAADRRRTVELAAAVVDHRIRGQ
jgi:hypothetical protein